MQDDSLDVLASAATSALYPSSSNAHDNANTYANREGAVDIDEETGIQYGLLPDHDVFHNDFLNSFAEQQQQSQQEFEQQLQQQLDQEINNGELSLDTFEQRVKAAIDANVRYQSTLIKSLDSLSSAIDRTKDLGVLSANIEKVVSRSPEFTIIAPGTQQPTLPYMKYLCDTDLPETESSKSRDAYISATRTLPWSPLERQSLRRAILDWNSTRADAQINPQLASEDEILSQKDGIDWEYISQQVPRRSSYDCKIRWLHHDHPNINKEKWTHEESSKLLQIVKDNPNSNWKKICSDLGTNRIPSECVRQYRYLTSSKQEWTKEEDDLLRKAIRMHGKSWQAVARHVGSKSGTQCFIRWDKSLKAGIHKGRWTTEEDTLLKDAIAAYGKAWKQVASRVPGRTDAQCRERWVNVLDPNVKRGNWSKEEDEKLLELYNKGLSWSEISKGLNGTRTDNKCMRRYEELCKLRKVESGELPASVLKRGRPPGARGKAPSKRKSPPET